MNAIFADKNVKSPGLTANQELCKLLDWLAGNKLTLNIKRNQILVSLDQLKENLFTIPKLWYLTLIKIRMWQKSIVGHEMTAAITGSPDLVLVKLISKQQSQICMWSYKQN